MTKPARPAVARARPARADGELDGPALYRLFRTASAWLDRNAAAVDAINVYPVPDGDTGSNLAATLRDALRGAEPASADAGTFAAGLARSALMSARGNSGVILSQFLRGFAEACGSAETLDAPLFAAALEHGARSAYGAVRAPQEGTILTVAREAGEAAMQHTEEGLVEAAQAALAAARDALARTPELLLVLKQAGVVDSGGFGFVVILEGMAQALRGESPPEQAHDAGRIAAGWLDATHDATSRFGYCTEFVVDARDAADIRGPLEALGDSVLVVASGTITHAHVHTDDPGAALQVGTACGSLLSVKVENMQGQAERLAASQRGPDDARGATTAVAVISVAFGPGLAEVARSLGAGGVVPCDSGANPSVQEITLAIDAAQADAVIVLPNHKNAILAAEQAAGASAGRVIIVPARSIPQGMSALLAFDPERGVEENAAAMRDAAGRVRTIEVTRAARSTNVGGRAIDKGTPIALIDGDLHLAAASALEALVAAIAAVEPAAGTAITAYGGRGVDAAALEAAAETLRRRFPESEVDVVAGGQPHYDFIAGVE